MSYTSLCERFRIFYEPFRLLLFSSFVPAQTLIWRPKEKADQDDDDDDDEDDDRKKKFEEVSDTRFQSWRNPEIERRREMKMQPGPRCGF